MNIPLKLQCSGGPYIPITRPDFSGLDPGVVISHDVESVFYHQVEEPLFQDFVVALQNCCVASCRILFRNLQLTLVKGDRSQPVQYSGVFWVRGKGFLVVVSGRCQIFIES
jgi:hypothetical protein